MRSSYLTLVLTLFLLVPGCKSPTKPVEEKRSITIEYPNYSEGIAITYLAKGLLREKMGYKVTMKMTTLDSIYKHLAFKETDICLDAWLPHTHSNYWADYGDKLEIISNFTENVRTGLVVPNYSQMHSIDDIPKYYPNEIIGVDSTTGIMRDTQNALKVYKLPNDLAVLTGPIMSQILIEAYHQKQEIVVTGWTPHWTFSRYQLRFLKDPLKIYTDTDNMSIISRKGFKEDHPDAYEFLTRFKMTDKQLNDLMFTIQVNLDAVKGVREWAGKNPELINQWVEGLEYTKKNTKKR